MCGIFAILNKLNTHYDNIFKDFTVNFVESSTRDIPSLGCGSLLLGEPCDKGGGI